MARFASRGRRGDAGGRLHIAAWPSDFRNAVIATSPNWLFAGNALVAIAG